MDKQSGQQSSNYRVSGPLRHEQPTGLSYTFLKRGIPIIWISPALCFDQNVTLALVEYHRSTDVGITFSTGVRTVAETRQWTGPALIAKTTVILVARTLIRVISAWITLCRFDCRCGCTAMGAIVSRGTDGTLGGIFKSGTTSVRKIKSLPRVCLIVFTMFDVHYDRHTVFLTHGFGQPSIITNCSLQA